MTYKTTVQLECSYGISEPWELQEATIEHEVALPYRELRNRAIRAVGGAYRVYGIMRTIEESNDD